jgi:hypothetical protein
MQRKAYELQVLVNGKRVKEYCHKGKTFVEGRKNSQYSIKVKNNSGTRVLAVVTVDGVNVISGEGGDESAGYVVNAYSALDVKGYRVDLENVGAFKFCAKGKSYCNEVGLEGNSGVIGVRIFPEKMLNFYIQPSVYDKDIYKTPSNPNMWPNGGWTYTSDGTNLTHATHTTDVADTILCSYNCSSEFDTGTTWGDNLQDRCNEVPFSAGDLDAELEIFYSSSKGLKSMGIDMTEKKAISYPKAFGRFAKPPKGWKG